MPVHFPRTHALIRRGVGSYVNGVWTPGAEAASIPIVLDIQPASASDYARVQALSEGRRITAMLRAYAAVDAGLRVAGSNGYPGDIIVYNGERYLVIGSAKYDTFFTGDTAHTRYMLALEVEHAAGEVTA